MPWDSVFLPVAGLHGVLVITFHSTSFNCISGGKGGAYTSTSTVSVITLTGGNGWYPPRDAHAVIINVSAIILSVCSVLFILLITHCRFFSQLHLN